jgi:hypothetical protein
MDVKQTANELRKEGMRLIQAANLLEGQSATTERPTITPTNPITPAPRKRKERFVTASTRRKLKKAALARWARIKAQKTGSPTPIQQAA